MIFGRCVCGPVAMAEAMKRDKHPLHARKHGKSEGVKVLDMLSQDTQDLIRIDARVVMYQDVSEFGHLDERRREERIQQLCVAKNLECLRLRGGHLQFAVGDQVVGEVKARFDRQVQASLHDALTLPICTIRFGLEILEFPELG
jgi:hypothetical protein